MSKFGIAVIIPMYVVPAILGSAALFIVLLVYLFKCRKLAGKQTTRQAEPLVHSINDDRCIGCDACVDVCPTNVLSMVSNKSRVLRFEDCIQCEACVWACPTQALVMHKMTERPPTYIAPKLDEFYQTSVPGQYLIGEVAGKPLIKNAVNLGRAAVEHILSTKFNRQDRVADVAIVGSGPAGLSAALTCIKHGLSYTLFEKDGVMASTIAHYPKGKLIMAEPADTKNFSLLPVFDSSKEELLPMWEAIVARSKLRISLNQVVESIKPNAGIFRVKTNKALYDASKVILATGLRGKPKVLDIPGSNLPKVRSSLDDASKYQGRSVCVVGGGDSSLEAALNLSDAGARVLLSYRGRDFSRAHSKNKEAIKSYELQRRISVEYLSNISEFTNDKVIICLKDGSYKAYDNDAAFILIGADMPVSWLKSLGVDFIERPHMHALPKSDELVRRLVPDVKELEGGKKKALAESGYKTRSLDLKFPSFKGFALSSIGRARIKHKSGKIRKLI